MIQSCARESLRLVSCASRAEQFSIWALRIWWRAFPELQAGWGDFLHGFRVCGVQPAIESCHRFCSIVLGTSARGSSIACVHFPHILAAEERLLAVLAAGQSGDVARVEELLREFVPPATARVAATQAARFAQVLANAGLDWAQVSAAPTSPTRGHFDHASLVSERLH